MSFLEQTEMNNLLIWSVSEKQLWKDFRRTNVELRGIAEFSKLIPLSDLL